MKNIRIRRSRVFLGLCLLASVLILAGQSPEKTMAAATACVAGPHTGTIATDQEWCLADSPHTLEGVVTIAPGVTVSVEPGATMITDGYPYYMGLVVQGVLESVGTASQGILFTHKDAGEGWLGIVIDGGSATLAYTTVEWGCSDSQRSNIQVVNGGNLVMTDSLVQECHNGSGSGAYNLRIDNANATVSHSTFATSELYPIYILGTTSQVTLTSNILEDNYFDRILLGANAMMGHDTTLSAQATWESYELEATMTVPAGVSLTLEPGVVIKTDSYPYDMGIIVQGELASLGTSERGVILTSVDGTPSWAGLIVDGGVANLAYTTVEDGCSDTRKSNVSVINGGRLEMADSLLQTCSYGGGGGEEMLRIENSQANIQRSTFAESSGEHVYVLGDSTVRIEDSILNAADENGILVTGDQAWVSVSGSTILSNGVWGGDGVRNTGLATVILSGDPGKGNFIAYNQDYGVNQVGLGGQIIATYNFWGDASGPTHAGNPAGSGEPVTDRVLYDPWLTEAPTGDLGAEMVMAFGPRNVSPGETIQLGFMLNNVLTETLTSAILVGQLPDEASYLLSSPEGKYWPERHQVIWEVGDLAPGESAFGALRVRYTTGLQAHLETYSTVLAAAQNLPNARIDLQEYLDYIQTTVISTEELSQQALDDLLAAQAGLDGFFKDSESQGFDYYGGARREHLSDGTDQVLLPMIATAKPGETIYLSQHLTSTMRLHKFPTSLLGDYAQATFEFDTLTRYLKVRESEENSLGSPSLFDSARQSTASCSEFGYDDCLHNCLVNNLPSFQFDEGLTANCYACYAYGENCTLCGMDLSFYHSEQVQNVVETCSEQCDTVRDLWKCEDANRQCVSSRTLLVTPCVDCGYDTSQNTFEACPPNTRCVLDSCQPIRTPETILVEVLIAGDPNELYGPEFLIPGQTITYTIAYENVGAGTAYGVFVESHLPDLFDESTLQIDGGGEYFPAARTLFWQVGELAAGAGGAVSFTLQVPPGAEIGSVVVANATVYFPSVPETTPTGDVVSIVADVAAYSQQIETLEGTPAPILLTGYTPTANPLTFEVVDDPRFGTLSGNAPSLAYTPATGFEGVDHFTFQVSDGLHTSLPATVMLTVASSAEAQPPQVLYTSPAAGATRVHCLDTQVADARYEPTIMAWFSEPLNPATLTAASVSLTGPGGQQVAGEIIFVAGPNRIEFRPSQPLSPGKRYTVTITSGVQDTSGNALSQPYTWRFTTQGDEGVLFLPNVNK